MKLYTLLFACLLIGCSNIDYQDLSDQYMASIRVGKKLNPPSKILREVGLELTLRTETTNKTEWQLYNPYIGRSLGERYVWIVSKNDFITEIYYYKGF